MRVGLSIRELIARSGQAPKGITLLHADGQLLFAKGTMEPIERHDGYVVAARVEVSQPGTGEAKAEIDVVIDPSRGPGAEVCAAAIERTTGAEATAVAGLEAPQPYPAPVVGQPTVYPVGLWRQRTHPGGGLPPAPPAGRHCVAFGFEQATPPTKTFGVVDKRHALQTLSGGLMRLGTYFPESDYRLRKALEDRPMNIASRVAWALAAVDGNFHDITIQLITLPISGRQRWVGEMVCCFGTELQVHAARGLLYGLAQIFDLTYPKPPNPAADPFDPSNQPPTRHDDPFDDLHGPSYD